MVFRRLSPTLTEEYLIRILLFNYYLTDLFQLISLQSMVDKYNKGDVRIGTTDNCFGYCRGPKFKKRWRTTTAFIKIILNSKSWYWC